MDKTQVVKPEEHVDSNIIGPGAKGPWGESGEIGDLKGFDVICILICEDI